MTTQLLTPRQVISWNPFQMLLVPFGFFLKIYYFRLFFSGSGIRTHDLTNILLEAKVQPPDYHSSIPSSSINQSLLNDQCDQILRNFCTFEFLIPKQSFKGSFSIWLNFKQTLAIFYTVGQILIVLNGQMLKNYIVTVLTTLITRGVGGRKRIFPDWCLGLQKVKILMALSRPTQSTQTVHHIWH